MALLSPALVIRFPDGTSPARRDRLSALLSDYDLVAIQEDDIEDPRVWTAHFARAGSRDAAAELMQRDPELAHLTIQSVDIEDEDWARRTQADLPAIRIGRVIVAPPWDLPPARTSGGSSRTPPDDFVVVIEPSRGFGTGHHQSTRLCLTLLQARNLAGQRVIDVGTGSGVLAITAAKLGAAVVAAIDSDPDAVENARENIAANGVEQTVEAHVDDLESTTMAPADVVLANLTGTLLSRHAADLERLVRPRGSLIISGFNIDERERVSEALAGLFQMTETAEEDGWHAFVLTR